MHWFSSLLVGKTHTHTHTHTHIKLPQTAFTWTKVLMPGHLVAQIVKNLPAMQKTELRSLGREDPLEKGTETHSSILAWRMPWTEEPGGLQSMRSQRVGHDWVTNTRPHHEPQVLRIRAGCTLCLWICPPSALRLSSESSPGEASPAGELEGARVPVLGHSRQFLCSEAEGGLRLQAAAEASRSHAPVPRGTRRCLAAGPRCPLCTTLSSTLPLRPWEDVCFAIIFPCGSEESQAEASYVNKCKIPSGLDSQTPEPCAPGISDPWPALRPPPGVSAGAFWVRLCSTCVMERGTAILESPPGYLSRRERGPFWAPF